MCRNSSRGLRQTHPRIEVIQFPSSTVHVVVGQYADYSSHGISPYTIPGTMHLQSSLPPSVRQRHPRIQRIQVLLSPANVSVGRRFRRIAEFFHAEHVDASLFLPRWTIGSTAALSQTIHTHACSNACRAFAVNTNLQNLRNIRTRCSPVSSTISFSRFRSL